MSRVLVGMGTCGLATGAGKVMEAVRKWTAAHNVDTEITPTGCLGFCQVEPIMDVVSDEGYRFSFGSVNPEEVGFILDETLLKKNYRLDGLLGQHRGAAAPLPGLPMLDEHPFFRKQVKFALRNCGIINPESIAEYRAAGGFQGLKKALASTPKAVIQEILDSGLRGRGGGGFLTGKKWQLAAQEGAARKFVICNADEGDPGAFMDRSLLEGDPFALLEGMIIAGYAIGAHEGVIYCRAEYPLAIQRLEAAIATLQEEGLLDREAPRYDGLRTARRAHAADTCAAAGGRWGFHLRIKKGAGRLRLRRGDGADGLHRGPARDAAAAAPVPGGLGAVRLPHDHQQRGDPGQRVPRDARGGGRPQQVRHRDAARAPRCSPSPARSTTPAWWRCRWASPCGRSSTTSAAASRTARSTRPCRSAGRPAAASRSSSWTSRSTTSR